MRGAYDYAHSSYCLFLRHAHDAFMSAAQRGDDEYAAYFFILSPYLEPPLYDAHAAGAMLQEHILRGRALETMPIFGECHESRMRASALFAMRLMPFTALMLIALIYEFVLMRA